jgi:hypothetical protein
VGEGTQETNRRIREEEKRAMGSRRSRRKGRKEGNGKK